VAITGQLEALDQQLRAKQAELNEQLQMTQADGNRGAGTQTQEAMQAESQFPADGHSEQQAELLRELREKT